MTVKSKTAKEPAKGKAKAKDKAPAAKQTKAEPRETKQALVLKMLGSKKGASVEEIAEATGWQIHTVRGFLSGAVKTKLGLTVERTKAEGEKQSRYRIAS